MAALFALVGGVAAATAAGTSGPWFSAALSEQVYATSLVAAIVVAVALAAVAATQVARLEDARRLIDLRIAALPEAAHLPVGLEGALTSEAIRTIPPSDEEVDELLNTLAAPMHDATLQAEIEYTGTLVEVSAALSAARVRKELLKALIVERTRVESARARAMPAVAGPITMCLLFALAAGAMLPGSEGYAAVHFQLNTGLVLFLGYGWMLLVVWCVLALAFLTTRGAEERPGPRPS